MSLSHNEQKQLEELERGINLEDPAFARKLRTGMPAKPARAPLWPGLLLMMAGMVVLLAGIAAQSIFIGVIGFLLMGAGGYRVVREPGLSRNAVIQSGK